ncbi:MAG: hypothetical protein GF411_14635 [Candidatus Lokiarchaeota archaeon]|nr:hypothetical protein [Candidatus Lokiarchaeota archaeon]
MDERRCRAREIRREYFKDKSEISIAHGLNQELVEDILAVNPDIQILQFELLTDTKFETELLSHFKSLIQIGVWGGTSLKEVDLKGLSDVKSLVKFVLSIQPTNGIDKVDISPLGNLDNLEIVNILCPLRKLIGLEKLGNCPNLYALQLASLDVDNLDLSRLSGSGIKSLHINDLGKQYPTQPYIIKMPRNIPLSEFVVSQCYSPELKVEIDFSWIEDVEAIDNLTLSQCNLSSFDLNVLSPLRRIGSIDLTENEFTHLDITPILDKPMFTEKTFTESVFKVDENVMIQIDKTKQDEIDSLIAKEDTMIEEHQGYLTVLPEFGHHWLEDLIEKHDVEWI